MQQVDTYQHKGLRQKLVNELKQKGINDTQVLQAINTVPRHFFLDSALAHIAYEDRAFPIAANQTISQPYTVAYQTQLLQLTTGMKVLEVGTGSGYQAAILGELKVKVFTIERQKTLYDLISKLPVLKSYINIKRFYGDGFAGLPTFAPFDRVIITAAAPEVPSKLIEQLKIGGKMIIPLNDGDSQIMQRITKLNEIDIEIENFERFSFVPMLVGKEK
jgi:protein-L-isoaspartate(D-aspartate) O-methyltransferase